jgi:hypothetical protein
LLSGLGGQTLDSFPGVAKPPMRSCNTPSMPSQ